MRQFALQSGTTCWVDDFGAVVTRAQLQRARKDPGWTAQLVRDHAQVCALVESVTKALFEPQVSVIVAGVDYVAVSDEIAEGLREAFAGRLEAVVESNWRGYGRVELSVAWRVPIGLAAASPGANCKRKRDKQQTD